MSKVTHPATSADMDFSRNGEPKKEDNWQSDVGMVSGIAARDSNRDEEKFIIFKLVDNTKEGGVHIPGIDDVINPKTGAVERVRLLSGVDTIWMKEQKDLTPDYVRQAQRNLVFPRGARLLRISERDKTALEFASLTNHNIGNPKRKTGSRFEFYEYNPAKQQQEALNKELLEIEMSIEASEIGKKDVLAMRKHAIYLGIQPFDELGMPKTDDGIRKEYIVAAKRNPIKFRDSLRSKAVEINYLIRKAISGSLIDLGGQSGEIRWSTGGYITRVPVGRDTIEYLMEIALNTTSDEGQAFVTQLGQIVKQ